MRTLDNHRLAPPILTRRMVSGPAPVSPRAPTRQQKLRARFRDEAIQTRTVLADMNSAARRMWGRPA